MALPNDLLRGVAISGGCRLIEREFAPMIPIIIKGTAQMMRKGSLKVFPGEAVVRFLPALYPQTFESREALMEAVRTEMQSVLDE